MFSLPIFVCPRIRKEYITFRYLSLSKDLIYVLSKVFEHHKVWIISLSSLLCCLKESFVAYFHTNKVFFWEPGYLTTKEISHTSTYLKYDIIIVVEILGPLPLFSIYVSNIIEYIFVSFDFFYIWIIYYHSQIP